MKCLQEIGIEIPKEVSLIGFDNIAIAGLTTPGLTTISAPWKNMADIAVEILIKQLQRGKETNLKTRIGVKLLERESCSVVNK